MSARHAKPKGIFVNAFEIAVMILLGSVGVVMIVLAHRPWRAS